MSEGGGDPDTSSPRAGHIRQDLLESGLGTEQVQCTKT
jgi:hypothetical protein